MDLADARSHILPRTHKNLIGNSQESASGLRARMRSLRASAQRAAVQVAPGGRRRRDPGRRPSAGSGRREPGPGGASLVAKATTQAANSRRSGTTCTARGPGAQRGRRAATAVGQAPAGPTRPGSLRSAGAQRHGQAGTVRSVPGGPTPGSRALLPPGRVRSRWAAPWDPRGSEWVGLLVWDSPSGRDRLRSLQG